MIRNVENRAQAIHRIDVSRQRGSDAPTIAGKLKTEIQTVEIIFDELDYRRGINEKPDYYKYAIITDEVWNVLQDIEKANEEVRPEEKTKIRVSNMPGGSILYGDKMRQYRIYITQDGDARCVLWSPPPSRGAPMQQMDLSEVKAFMGEIAEVIKTMQYVRRSIT